MNHVEDVEVIPGTRMMAAAREVRAYPAPDRRRVAGEAARRLVEGAVVAKRARPADRLRLRRLVLKRLLELAALPADLFRAYERL